MKKVLLLILTLFYVALNSKTDAKCVKQGTVKYEKQEGWSNKYTVEITFMTGDELNKSTETIDYSFYSNYALIFWGEGRASIIKLNSYLLCGLEVTCACIDNNILDLQGFDQDGDKWNICLSAYCN